MNVTFHYSFAHESRAFIQAFLQLEESVRGLLVKDLEFLSISAIWLEYIRFLFFKLVYVKVWVESLWTYCSWWKVSCLQFCSSWSCWKLVTAWCQSQSYLHSPWHHCFWRAPPLVVVADCWLAMLLNSLWFNFLFCWRVIFWVPCSPQFFFCF